MPNFSEYLNQERENLLIIDGLNFAFRFKRANKKVFAPDFVQTVHSFAKSYNAKTVVVLGDAGSNWRKEIYPEYKANRKEMQTKQTDEERQEFQEFLDEFGNAFTLCGETFNTFRFKGVEADDIAAYLTKKYYDDPLFEHIWLVSSDRDWDLLVNDRVSRFSYLTRKETTVDTWDELYNYPIEMAMCMKALAGDKGDNVPKPEGLGEKRAYTILKEYGTVFDVYESLPISDKRKFIQNLNNFGEQLLTNIMLVDLLTYCEEAIGNNNIEIIDRVMEDV